jgi:hypothetical protein
MRPRKLAPWVLTLSALGACGGRYESNPKASDGVDETAGATSSTAGTSSIAGASGSAGADGASGSAGAGADMCMQQKLDYAVERSQVLEEFAKFGCKSSRDCVSTWDPSNCSLDCSYVVTTAAGRGVVDRLVTLGQKLCTGPCIPPTSSCPPLPPAECLRGRCFPGLR